MPHIAAILWISLCVVVWQNEAEQDTNLLLDSNKNHVIQVPETPLSEDGWSQARRMAERVKREFKVTKIISSDLQRAVDTATCLKDVVPGVNIALDEGLRERDLGNHRGRSYASLREANIEVFDPTNPTVEKEEPFQRRVNAAWERIKDVAKGVGHSDAVAFVTHGLVLRHIFENILGLSEAPQTIQNTSITVLEAGSLQVANGVVNCAKHLGKEAEVKTKAMI